MKHLISILILPLLYTTVTFAAPETSPTEASKALSAPAQISANTPFLEAFPQLKNYIYVEPPSGFFLGLGIAPVGVLRDRMMFTGNFFELHWIKERYDIEILNAAYSFTRAQSAKYQSTHFTFRASPKYRFFGVMSIGPLFGYELVSFPGAKARVSQLPKVSRFSEPFSSRGWIYGMQLDQTFKYGNGNLIKVSEAAYQQTYSTTKTAEGWNWLFDDPELRQDTEKIKAGTVFMLSVSFLY